ncbi:MAG: hypothetical protein F4Y04_01885 [Chloroflexi bacterium]|nr:hypothetical protein [Chloroflexota bacterium]
MRFPPLRSSANPSALSPRTCAGFSRRSADPGEQSDSLAQRCRRRSSHDPPFRRRRDRGRLVGGSGPGNRRPGRPLPAAGSAERR